MSCNSSSAENDADSAHQDMGPRSSAAALTESSFGPGNHSALVDAGIDRNLDICQSVSVHYMRRDMLDRYVIAQEAWPRNGGESG